MKVDRHGGLDGQGDAENTSVTAVICTYNGARVIPRALEALSQQTFYGPAEVVVVDNNSQDGVAEEAERYWNALNRRPFPMRCVQERQPGIAFARRTGVMAAKSEVIVFCDDDNLLSPDYFARAVKALADPGVGAAGGCCVPTSDSDFPPFFYTYARHYAVGVPQLDSGPVDAGKGWLYGAGLTARRRDLLGIYASPTFPNLTGRVGSSANASGDDLELCLSLRLLGYKLVYDEALTFRHHIEAHKLEKEHLRALQSGNKNDSETLLLYRPLLDLEANRSIANLIRKVARIGLEAMHGRRDKLSLFWILSYFRAVPLMTTEQARIFRHCAWLSRFKRTQSPQVTTSV